MRYMPLTGTTRTGTVWSPGPVANSLWVLDDETGEPVVVKVPKGDVSAAHELVYALPERTETEYGVKWARNNPMGRYDRWRGYQATIEHTPAADYRHVAKLPEKVWRAAVGDQCEQLELTAA